MLTNRKESNMEQNSATLDIGALNEKIEKESAFIDILTLEINKDKIKNLIIG